MKKIILIALCFTGCASSQLRPEQTSQFCVVLDSKIGLYRCETQEVVTYGVQGTQPLFSAKPQKESAPKPAATPAPEKK